jgi:diguanylate cyclase (GGDEF)-like protein
MERHLWENRRMAHTDDLTGLPNRRVLAAALENAVGEPTGLAVIDLNGFKEVNDSFGHEVGDELLRVVSRRLHEAVRPEDVLVRMGGDEFAVLISGCNDISSAESVAHRLLRAFTDPFAVAGIRIRVGASAGVACDRVDTASARELLRHADLAMYRAKAARTGVVGHDGRRDAGAAERVALMAELGDGLSQGQIVPYYQPQVDIRSGHVVGAEALARWEHPERGVLVPGSFLRAVEQTNLSGALTRSILERAVSDCAAWKRDGLEVPVSVNLTGADIVDEAFPDLVSGALAEHGLAPDRLCLEITEHFVASDPARALAVLMRLREQGVRLALDDYGIDRSSLSHLDQLPVNELKIDRSFVSQIVSNERTALIVASTIGLAQGLGIRAVAEGVEDQATLDALRTMGSPAIQGFLIARPMSARSLPAWIRSYNAGLIDHTSVASSQDTTEQDINATESLSAA